MKINENLTTNLIGRISTEFSKYGGDGTNRMEVQNGFINSLNSSLGENKDKNKKEQVIKRKIKKGVSDKIVGTPKLDKPIGKMYSSIGGESNESTGVGSAGGFEAPLFSVTKKEMDEMKQTSFKAPKLTMFSDEAPKPIKNNESIEDLMEGKNTPTNPSLWSRAKAAAKSKYKVYPSAYANGFAAKWYKKHGGGWKKKSSNESKEFNEASSPAQQAAIAINMKKKGIKPKNENVNEDLRNWFKEKWVDVSKKVDGKHPPCGRKDADGKAYPKCRPSKKVSSETPKVASSYDKDEKKAMTQQKRRAEKNNPKVGKDNKPTMTKFDNKKVETKEATGASSAGSYLTTAAWAKSTKKKDWRGKSKTQIPGGKFVQVKEKCKKFPYCNQGDIKSLNIFENETFKKVIKNISEKHGISENVIKSILSYEYYNNK